MAAPKLKHNIVTAAWLEQHLHNPDLVLLDGSWHLPDSGRDGMAEYIEAHIPSAQYFDFNRALAADSALPHMLPSPQQFQQAVRAMGISNDTAVVVYDSVGLFSAARVWWMFRAMGHQQVAVLNGGLPAWLAQEGSVSAGNEATRTPGQFIANYQPQLVADKREMQLSLNAPGRTIVDARGPARFAGKEPEPRPGVSPGHMPGAINLHYASLLEGGKLQPPFLAMQQFIERGIDAGDRQLYSCGSGVTACILALAASEIGVNDWAVYDGSWAEWGAAEDTVKVTD